MNSSILTRQFVTVYRLGLDLARDAEVDSVLLLLEGPTDWEEIRAAAEGQKILIAADSEEQVAGAREAGLEIVVLDMKGHPVFAKLTQAVIEAVADDMLTPGGDVVAVYSGFEAGKIDSVSYIRLDEHLGRLTVRDLRQLETKVPLDTLKIVVDLAVEIGREGREGKPVGTMFVVGDSKKVLATSYPTGFDPVKGYKRDDRNLGDRRVREGIKEIAQMDGAFVISSDGTVDAACRFLDAPAEGITMSKGLGARHWAAAAISKKTNALAVVVSESNGTVRIFHHGEVVLRIEPFRRAMKWVDFEYEPPPAAAGD